MLDRYLVFVDGVTSEASKNHDSMMTRLNELRQAGMDVSRLLTASDGLCSEAGEFKEIIKKCVWQGKPYSEDNIYHMKRELGDVMWYWAQACMALSLDPHEVIEENVRKLESRFPGGSFDITRSENRREGDL